MDGNTQKVGVLISTVADDGGIKTAQAELTVLGDTAKKSAGTATSAFDNFNSSLKKFGDQTTAVGRTMTTGLSLPLAGIAAASVKMAMDFNQSMTYVRTDAGDTSDNIQTLSNQVLQLAKNSQFSPDALANGLYHLASLGLRGADAMNALNTAQQMASVGGADLESTATALGGALVSGIDGVQNYTQAAGVLDATIGAGNMRMQQLVDAIGTGVLPVFKNAGLNITDFGAALATLTDNGQDASAAATHLRMTIALMEAPSQKAISVLEGIGLTQSSLAMDMRTKGLVPALQDLQQHLLDTYGTTDKGKTQMAAALDEMFGGGRSSAAIQTLLDEMDRVQAKETQIGSQSGEFASKVAEQQQTASAQFKTAWDAVQANAIQLGNVLMPSVTQAMTQLSHGISDVSGWFQSLSSAQQEDVIKFAEILAAVGPVLLIFGKLAKSTSEILTLTKTLSGAFAVFDTTKAVSSVARLATGLGSEAGLAAGAGEATTALAGGGGLVAALATAAPVLIAASLALGGAYLIWKKFKDDGAIDSKSLYDGGSGYNPNAAYSAQQLQQNATNKSIGDYITASNNASKAAAQQVTASKSVVQAQKDSQTAQDAVTKALNIYGQNSPQYIKAKQDLQTASDNLANKLADEANANLTVTSTAYQSGNAQGYMKQQMQQLHDLGPAVQAQLDGIAGKIATIGINSQNDMVPIGNLQGSITGLSTSWNGLQTDILGQIPVVNQKLMESGNEINTLQGQNDKLNSSLQSTAASINAITNGGKGTGITIHGSMTGGSTGITLNGAFASGTSYAPGGPSVVHEQGPEVMDLPTGTRVYPARQSAGMMGSGGVNLYQTNHVYNQVDLTMANRELGWELATMTG